MTFSEEQIEWIVMEVLRRVAAAGDAKTSSSGAVGSELKLDERVVTLRSIEGRLSGVTRLVVRARAIVTPAVKDELKQRKVELVTADTKLCPTKT